MPQIHLRVCTSTPGRYLLAGVCAGLFALEHQKWVVGLYPLQKDKVAWEKIDLVNFMKLDGFNFLPFF